MIDATKPVQTRDGRPARIVCTDRKGDVQPILALVQGPCSAAEDLHCYYGDGSRFPTSQSPLDLINIPERFEIKRWVNVYDVYKGYETYHSSREQADTFSRGDRIACIPITISGVVGEGLEAK